MNKALLAYFGHHKCASTWMTDIINHVTNRINIKTAIVHNSGMFKNDLADFIEQSQIQFLIYTNACYQYVSDLDSFKGFHIIRDPRDIVVSAYFSHRFSHPTRGLINRIQYREHLNAVPMEQGLFLVMDFIGNILNDIYDWNYSPKNNIIELKMEDVIENPAFFLIKIFRFLGILNPTLYNSLPYESVAEQISLKDLLVIIDENSFEKKANGRKRGIEDIKSHYRKGISNDWINYFKSEHKEYFKKKYPNLLIKLGYETNNNW